MAFTHEERWMSGIQIGRTEHPSRPQPRQHTERRAEFSARPNSIPELDGIAPSAGGTGGAEARPKGAAAGAAAGAT